MSQDRNLISAPAFAGAIRNPANPNHLMVIKPVANRIRVYVGDILVADTLRALRVMEIGSSVYDPVVYSPGDDLATDFQPVEKSTHCPIKGDASYVALNGEEIGWVYRYPIDIATALAGHYGFWPAKTRLVEGD